VEFRQANTQSSLHFYFSTAFKLPSLLCAALQVLICVMLGVILSGCGGDKSGSQDADQANNSIQRAETYRKQGQYRPAMIELKKAAKAQANTDQLRMAQSALAMDLGQYRAVVELLEQISPGDRSHKAEQMLIEAYVGLKKLASAEQFLAGSIHLTEDEKKLALGQIALYRGEAEKAKKLLEEVLATDPMIGKAHIGLAAMEAKSGDFSAAIERLSKYIEQKPSDIPVQIAYAKITYSSGKVEAAEDILSNTLIELPQTDVIQPEKRLVLNLLVEILTQQGRTSEAMVYLKSLSEENPIVSEQNRQYQDAMAAWERYDLDESRRLFELIYEQTPADRVGTMLGMIAYLQGDHQKATEYFERHTDPETASANVLNVMSRAMVREGKLQSAKAAVEKARLNDPDNPNIQGLEGLLMLSSKSTEGKEAVEQSLKENPKQRSLWIALSRYYAYNADPKKAEQALNEGLGHFPDNFQLQRALVALKLKHHASESARELVEQWLKAEEADIGLRILQGDIAIVQKRYANAVESYKAVLSTQIDNERTRLSRQKAAQSGLVKANLLQRNFSQAQTESRSLIELDPTDQQGYKHLISSLEASGTMDAAKVYQLLSGFSKEHKTAAPLLVLIEYYYRNQLLDRAKEVLATVQELYPDEPDVADAAVVLAYRSARLAASQKEYATARNHLLEGLKAFPDNLVLNQTLIRVELADGNTREAQKLIERLNLTKDREHVREHLRGELASAEGNYPRAERLFSSAWQTGGGDASAHRVYQALKAQKKAVIPFLKEWLESSKEPASAALVLANEYLEQGDYKKAAAGYEQLLGERPDNALLLNNLAWCYYMLRDDRALTTAEKAAKLAGNSAAVLDTLGVILDAEGQTERAVKILERAVSLAPNELEIKQHLEQALKKL